MQFDFDRFARIAATAYREGGPYSLLDALSVFRCYFQTYEDFMGHPHPPIRREQITKIIEAMPYIIQEDRGGWLEYISPESYAAMIRRHFETEYWHCDYNINHFFTGRIRELRYYEEILLNPHVKRKSRPVLQTPNGSRRKWNRETRFRLHHTEKLGGLQV